MTDEHEATLTNTIGAEIVADMGPPFQIDRLMVF